MPKSCGRTALAVLLLLLIVLQAIAGCAIKPAGDAAFAALPTTAGPSSSPTPSPSPTPPPTLTPLPTVPVALTSGPTPKPPTATSTATPSPSPTATPTPTPTATPTPTPTATATASATPTPTATATPILTPTETIAATPTQPPAPDLSPSATLTATLTPERTPTPQFSPTPMPTTAINQDIVHILLIGGDTNYALDMNTDTLIVVVIDRKSKQVSLLSIPRDLWVHIPTYGWGRINIAYRIGARTGYPEGRGIGLLTRTIKDNIGISIDHWVRIGYKGFAQVVDELGGVDMIVACPVNLRYEAPTSDTEEEQMLYPGVHHLDGPTALHYVRTRRGDSDFERAGRQQQFLKAVWAQFKSPETLLKIPALWSAMKDSFATDLELGDILALAPIALDLQPQRVRSRYIGRGQVEGWTTAEGMRVLLPIPEKIQQVVASLYTPPAADPLAEEGARIQVLNGTYRPQLALIAADQLRWRGLNIVSTGAADRADYSQTQIIVFNDKPQAVERLAQLLKVKPQNILQQPDPNQPVDVQVILGTDYDPCP